MSTGRLGAGDTAIQPTILNAKGDLIAATAADTPAALTVGANGTVLTAASGEATGLQWAAPTTPAVVGCSIKRENVSTAMTANTAFAVAFTTQNFDTDSFHDTSTNNTRITIPSGKGGKYLVSAFVNNAFGTNAYALLSLYKNGAQFTAGGFREGNIGRNNGEPIINSTQVVELAASDYLELYYQQQNSETVNMWFVMSAIYLGA
jgi:hypothetical protein